MTQSVCQTEDAQRNPRQHLLFLKRRDLLPFSALFIPNPEATAQLPVLRLGVVFRLPSLPLLPALRSSSAHRGTYRPACSRPISPSFSGFPMTFAAPPPSPSTLPSTDFWDFLSLSFRDSRVKFTILKVGLLPCQVKQDGILLYLSMALRNESVDLAVAGLVEPDVSK
ncbi:uncharacterized protein VTP21DRAFT_11170 [Calcarisporiella thermophila]|uniref:uncharacterized protein n=1 Tax=Calcarisporiella thermophila TaxID=911321 RepID=UPI003744482F